MNLKNNRAFTLVELMIVVAIIGILAASAVPKFADLINKTKEAAAKGNLTAIRSAVTIYYATIMDFPTELDGIIPDNMTRLPGASVPTYPGGEWKEGEFISTDDPDYVLDPTNKGTTNGSVDGNNEDGWAYYPEEGEVWIETIVEDTSGSPVHGW